MYINISLRRFPITDNDNNDCIERIYKENNVSYLCKEDDAVNFPNLAQVESYDYSVFAKEDMDDVIEELLKVRQDLTNSGDQKHVDDIIQIAEKCKNIQNTVLMFSG